MPGSVHVQGTGSNSIGNPPQRRRFLKFSLQLAHPVSISGHLLGRLVEIPAEVQVLTKNLGQEPFQGGPGHGLRDARAQAGNLAVLVVGRRRHVGHCPGMKWSS